MFGAWLCPVLGSFQASLVCAGTSRSKIPQCPKSLLLAKCSNGDFPLSAETYPPSAIWTLSFSVPILKKVAWLWLMKSLLCSFWPFHFSGGWGDSGLCNFATIFFHPWEKMNCAVAGAYPCFLWRGAGLGLFPVYFLCSKAWTSLDKHLMVLPTEYLVLRRTKPLIWKDTFGTGACSSLHWNTRSLAHKMSAMFSAFGLIWLSE